MTRSTLPRYTGLAVLGLMLVPGGARADDPPLMLSLDGVIWTANLHKDLFDTIDRWVPGDSHTTYFWVRNQSTDPGVLTITIEGTRTDALMEAGALEVKVRGGGGRWTPVNRPGTRQLLRVGEFAPDHQERVAVTVGLDPQAGNAAQGQSLDLAFGVQLEQRVEAAPDDDGSLPSTGGPALTWVALGTVAIGLGVSVLHRRSKRDHHA